MTMAPDLDALLRGIDYTVRHVLEPELESAFARSQANALLQVVGILRERVEKQQVALLDENSVLVEGLKDVLATVFRVDGTVDAQLHGAIVAQLEQTYAEHRGQRTIAGLAQERFDLRALHVRIMRSLCEGPAFKDGSLAALRDRLKERYARGSGLTALFVSAWIE